MPLGSCVPYLSTRDARTPPERLGFEDVLLAGLAPDGGLYVPDAWPHFDAASLRALRGRSYAEIACAVMAPFIGDALPPAALQRLVAGAYHGFDHAAVAPLKQLGPESGCWSCSTGPRSPSRTMPCSCSARSSTMR